MGLERAHTEFLGQGQGVLVVGFGLGNIRGMALCGDLTEKPERMGLVTAFLLRTEEPRARWASVSASSLLSARRYALLSQAT